MTPLPIPTGLAGAPLDELKQWLAITGTRDDALLVRLLETACQMCTQFTGIAAATWPDFDEALRQGIIRHAACRYRERDSGAAEALPAAIAALWRPFRTLRL
jgi:hypothetical protein